jgi:DNA-binding transcriptional LysR family regulator
MRDLQLLAMLDEVGSLSAAAAALSLTQPAVSKILVELEQIFGSRLFERGRRGVEPTPIGLAAIRRARSIVGELGLASAELKAMREGAAGLLQLGTFSITDIVPIPASRSGSGKERSPSC